MKTIFPVLTTLVVSLGAGFAPAGTFVFTSPEGETVPVLNETAKAFLSLPADRLDAHLRDPGHFERFRKARTRPVRVRFAWAYRPDAGEKPPKRYVVAVRRAETGRVIFRADTERPEIALDNLEIAAGYVLRASVCTERGKELFGADRPFRTEDLPPRVLNVEGVGNFRDLGGWIGEGGKRVKQGLVYRSQGLNDNADWWQGKDERGKKIPKPDKGDWRAGKVRGSPESRRQCRATLGIRTELDLRRCADELWGMCGSPLGSSVDWRPVPSSAYGGMDAAGARLAFVRDFRTFLNRDNYPILFHCIGGADRTGTLAYILNGLLGVGADDLERDYHFTAACQGFPWPMASTNKPCRIEGFKKVLAKYPGATVNERIRAYVLDCGITEAEIATFKSIMFGEDAPAERNAYATFADVPSSERRVLMRDAGFRDALHARDGKWDGNGPGTGVPRWHAEAPNCRDLGGWRTKDGARIRFGRLFRSAAIDSPEVRTALVKRLGVKTDLDLRAVGEARPTADLPAVTVPAPAYAAAVEDPKWLRKAFDVLLDEANYPIVFHCAKGADRTGTLAAALELLLGVDEDDVAKDWQLTAVYNRNPLFESIRYDRLMAALAKLKGETWQAKAEAWVRSAGVTDAEIAQFRERMLERPKIVFGLVSDTHVCSPLARKHGKGVAHSDERLGYAFRWMAAEGVDAVVNAGDVTELGTLEEVSLYRKIFDREFERGLCRDGKRPVAHFSVWGNHDCLDASYMRRGADWLVTNRAELVVGNYERLNGEMAGAPFGDGTFARQIRGVWFAGVNWKNATDGAAVIDRVATAAGPSNACFFVKHSPALTPGERAALARHPNCVRFTGHSHTPFTAENALCVTNGSVWSVSGSTSSCGGGGAQAAIVRVWADGITLDRREVKTGDRLGSVGFGIRAFAPSVKSAAAAALPSWRGAAMSAWLRGSHQIGKAACADGAVCGESLGSDPFWTIGVKPFRPTATQEVVFRAKTPVGGAGEIYWAPVGARGPTPATRASFAWIGDGVWHEYRVRPFWQGGGDIRTLRIDYPNTAVGRGEIALADVRVVDEIAAVKNPIGDSVGVTFACTSTVRERGEFAWVSDAVPGVRRETFLLAADGRPHRYSLMLANRPGWSGNLVWTSFTHGKPCAPLAVSDFRIATDDVEIPADLMVVGVNWATPACRAGTDGRIEAVVKNLGSEPAAAVGLRVAGAPDGLVCTPDGAKAVGGGFTDMLAVTVRAARPLEGPVKLEIVQDGKVVTTREVAVKILPSLGLPACDGVPEPHPPKCDYQIGALYYPGWERAEAWKRVWQTCPERRPCLGWYDETKSEVVDWQIKWLSENGIGALYVDWYWNRGHRHHEHWIAAFRKAKWRKYLKWAVMWANHTPAGAHSVEDQRAATRFWIDNYFNMPEYLTHGGKPVVWIWQGRNMDRDLGAGGCRKLLDLSREMAVGAGYRGIHFIAMKWPEDVCTASVMEGYRAMGFDEVGIYHFMGHGGKAADPRRFPYGLVADANPDHWRRQLAAKSLPFLPNLSTGWDDRPWNDQIEICGKNATDFRRICREAKRFADETGIRRLCVSPVNEWGEGSYAEPNAEHGFGFYEAVRDTFCVKPSAGWPQNMLPADVGLGPYDLPLPQPPEKVTAWDFTDGRSHGWKAIMGCNGERLSGEGLSFETETRDPATGVSCALLRARDYKTVTVRMRLENARGRAVVFWARDSRAMCGEANALLPVVSDGKFHDYVFPVAGHRRWRGSVGALRLDPCENPGARVTVAMIRLD